jgi:proteasome lid subunit RPN8/RPN11
VLSPLAWLKLQFLLHAGDTEIGGFGVSHEQNLLYVDDVAIVSQQTTSVSVEFDDTAVADLFDQMADRDIPPQRFMRIWMHTHPGDSAQPSGLDEQTFTRVFGSCDWALMFIIARTGEIYARLRVNGGPGAELLIPVRIDWPAWPRLAYELADRFPDLIRGWADEYLERVHPIPFASGLTPSAAAKDRVLGVFGVAADDPFIEPEWREYMEELAMQEEAERQMVTAGQGVVQ